MDPIDTLRRLATGLQLFPTPKADPVPALLAAKDQEAMGRLDEKAALSTLARAATGFDFTPPLAEPTEKYGSFFAGGPSPMEPTLQEQQQGATIEPGQTRRPNVLPVTVDAQTGQPMLAMPRVFDLMANALPGAVPAAVAPPKVLAGEKVLGGQPVSGLVQADLAYADVIKGYVDQGMQLTKGEASILQKADPAKYDFAKQNGLVTDAEYVSSFPPKPAQPEVPPEQVLANLKSLAETGQPAPMANKPLPWSLDEIEAEFNKLLGPAPVKQVESPVLPSEAGKAPEVPHDFLYGTQASTESAYKEFISKGIALDAAEAAEVAKFWPDMYQEAAKKGLIGKKLPDPISYEEMTGPARAPVVEPVGGTRRSKRMIYEDRRVGPAPPIRDLPMDEASRLQRARDLGFNLDLPLYTGVPNKGVEPPVAFKDPRAGDVKTEPAIFLSDSPHIASQYAEEGTVMPIFARMQNPAIVDWPAYAGRRGYAGDVMYKLLKNLVNEGRDSAILKGMDDIGGTNQTQYLALDPNILRSKFARFDPKNIDANDLLATLALMAGAGGAMVPSGAKADVPPPKTGLDQVYAPQPDDTPQSALLDAILSKMPIPPNVGPTKANAKVLSDEQALEQLQRNLLFMQPFQNNPLR